MVAVNELLAKRKNNLHNCRAILEKAEAGKRELAADEREQYDRLWNEASDIKAETDRILEAEDRKSKLNDALADLDKSRGRRTSPAQPAAGHDGANAMAPYTFALTRPFGSSRSGKQKRKKYQISLPQGSAAWLRHQPEYMRDMRNYLGLGRMGQSLQFSDIGPGEISALQTDVNTAGGYMVLPEQFVAELLKNVDDERWIRKLARIFTTNAQTLGVVKRTNKMASFTWGAELTDADTTKDTTLAYGKRTLTPHYMVGEINVSRDLLRSAMLPVEEYVRYEIARDSGELEENAFQTGSGAGRPLGLFTADSNGIDTGRDFSTGNTTTAIGADNLRYVKYSLKPQYRAHPSLRWLFHRDAVNQISRLKDGMGQYLWRDGIAAGDPDRILNIPVVESEFSPNTFTTGQYVGILGAFWWYWIADSLEMDIMTLVERRANTNEIQYIARRKTDGMPQLAEAFGRVKLA